MTEFARSICLFLLLVLNGTFGDFSTDSTTCQGTRYYDPISGRFLTADPLGHESDPSLYVAFGGDPINYFDPDGRFARGVYNGVGSFGSDLSASAAIALDALFKPIVGLFDPFAAQMHFSGGYKPNPAFANAYYSGSDAFRAGHQVGYFGAELGTSAALGYGLGRVLAPPLGGVGYAMGISSRPFWGGLGFADDAFAATRTGSAGLFGDAFGMGATRTGSAFGYEWGASRTFSAGGTAFGTDLRTSWGFFDDTLTGSSGGSRFLGNSATVAKGTTQLEFGFVKNLENPNFVLYKTSEFNRSMLRPGEYTLNLPWLRNETLDWAQNQQALRRAMNIGNPIREVNPNALGGWMQRERDFLSSQGWQRNQEGSDVFWAKPSGQ